MRIDKLSPTAKGRRCVINPKPRWTVDRLHEDLSPLIQAIEESIIGKRPIIEYLLCAVLAQGHVLLDDVPGVGKTSLAKALARSFGLSYRRIQFTPDLLPTDITGVSIYHPGLNQFIFQPGPVFANLVLADEINRTSPRTQSALLEVMEEGQVTVDGLPRAVPRPFIVVATQNPLEYEGTFPLPESQLDRFLMRLEMGYPSPEEEMRILAQVSGPPAVDPPAIMSADRLKALQDAVKEVHVSDSVRRYLADIAQKTRQHPQIHLGMSPRASLALQHAAKSWAFLHGRLFVVPDDIAHLAPLVVGHRLILAPGSPTAEGQSGRSLVKEVLASVPPPVAGDDEP